MEHQHGFNPDPYEGRVVGRPVDGDPHKAPLLLCQRFRGTMDDRDPEFVARLATERRVIRFDNLGIGESGGETPITVRGMAEVVPPLLDALGIGAVDLLGWSLGGYVGQTVALTWPERVRHLVIAGRRALVAPTARHLIHASRT